MQHKKIIREFGFISKTIGDILKEYVELSYSSLKKFRSRAKRCSAFDFNRTGMNQEFLDI